MLLFPNSKQSMYYITQFPISKPFTYHSSSSSSPISTYLSNVLTLYIYLLSYSPSTAAFPFLHILITLSTLVTILLKYTLHKTTHSLHSQHPRVHSQVPSYPPFPFLPAPAPNSLPFSLSLFNPSYTPPNLQIYPPFTSNTA